jgi:hypothetical protein
MIDSKRQRWAGPFMAEPAFHQRPSAPREIPVERDIVALMLAEDARSKPRELWLGLALATATVALFASGAGVPVLAVAFCLAPVIGIGLEIFPTAGRREA